MFIRHLRVENFFHTTMDSRSVLIIVAFTALFALALAYPIQYEDSEVVLVPLRRYPRSNNYVYRPRRTEGILEKEIIEPEAQASGYGHSHHPYDYVDYGAYTGGYGAFGWYTDHPVHSYH